MTDTYSELEAVDLSKYAKEKGKFHYVPWAVAWSEFVKRVPDATYALSDDKVYPDGTMEVRCSVTARGCTHTMWLPVTNYSNRPIERPDAFAVNTARMRCFTKCLSMFGLGSSYFKK